MTNARTLAAVIVLATAVCVQQPAVPSASHARTSAQSVESSGLARRLTATFQRAVATARLHVTRQEHLAPSPMLVGPVEPQSSGRVFEETPFHFRLPPPAV